MTVHPREGHTVNQGDLPAVIGELRKAWLGSGVTLASVGQRMGGIPSQNVSQMLDGTRDVRLSTLIRLAAALGYDLALVPRTSGPDDIEAAGRLADAVFGRPPHLPPLLDDPVAQLLGLTPGHTSYEVRDSPKMLRETLCVAQSAIGRPMFAGDRKSEHIDRLQRLIDACDRHRPLGPDGKHGDRHTASCGCEASG
jgi:hypothetical protein